MSVQYTVATSRAVQKRKRRPSAVKLGQTGAVIDARYLGESYVYFEESAIDSLDGSHQCSSIVFLKKSADTEWFHRRGTLRADVRPPERETAIRQLSCRREIPAAIRRFVQWRDKTCRLTTNSTGYNLFALASVPHHQLT